MQTLTTQLKQRLDNSLTKQYVFCVGTFASPIFNYYLRSNLVHAAVSSTLVVILNTTWYLPARCIYEVNDRRIVQSVLYALQSAAYGLYKSAGGL